MSVSFNLENYFKTLDFDNSKTDSSLKSFHRFLCTVGNKETEFSTMLSSELDRFLALKHPDFWVASNQEIDGSLRSGLVWEVTKSKSGSDHPLSKTWDLLLIQHYGQSELHAVVEFKTNRHNAFLDKVEFDTNEERALLVENEKLKWNSLVNKKHWSGVLFDIKTLNELSKIMPEVQMWHGTLLYSLHAPISLNKPKVIGKYLKNEPLKSRADKITVGEVYSQEIFNNECEENTKLFMKVLAEEAINLGYLDLEENNKAEWIHKKVATGEYRGLFVRSDLVLLKVAG